MSSASIDPAFIFGSAGAGEWIVLFIVILIVVGPKRLPDVARKLGRMMEMFRRAADEFKRQIMTMDQPPPPPYDPPPTQTDYDADGVSDPYGDPGQDYLEEDRIEDAGDSGETVDAGNSEDAGDSGNSDETGQPGDSGDAASPAEVDATEQEPRA